MYTKIKYRLAMVGGMPEMRNEGEVYHEKTVVAGHGAAIALNCGMAFAETEEEVSGDLSIYLWDNEYAALAVVEAYQEKYPNVNVELNVTPFMDYQTKLFTSLAGGETMDIFFMRE